MGWWQKFKIWRAFSGLQSQSIHKNSAAKEFLSENWNEAILTQLIDLLGPPPYSEWDSALERHRRQNIVQVLGNINHASALKVLVGLTNRYTNKDMSLLFDVERLLVKQGAATLLQILDQHDGKAFNGVFIEKSILIALLGKTRDILAVQRLLDIAHNPKEAAGDRTDAVLALGLIGDCNVVPALIELLDDADLFESVLIALKDLPSVDALDPLLEILSNHHADTFQRSQAALAQGNRVLTRGDRMLMDWSDYCRGWQEGKAAVVGPAISRWAARESNQCPRLSLVKSTNTLKMLPIHG